MTQRTFTRKWQRPCIVAKQQNCTLQLIQYYVKAGKLERKKNAQGVALVRRAVV